MGNQPERSWLAALDRDAAYRLAYRLTGNSHDAEEAVQNALVRAVRGEAHLPAEAERTKWFLGAVASAAKNLTYSERRRMRRERMVASSMDQKEQAKPARHALKEQVAAALEKLDERLRAAVSLRHEQGLSYAEAAEILGVSEVALRKQVSRGLERLREILHREGQRVAPAVIVSTLGQGLGVQAPPSLAAAWEQIVKHGAPPKASNVSRVRRGQSGSSVSAPKIAAAGAAALLLGLVLLALLRDSRPVPTEDVPFFGPAASTPENETADTLLFHDDFEHGVKAWIAYQAVIPSQVEPATLGAPAPACLSNPTSARPPNRTRVLAVDAMSGDGEAYLCCCTRAFPDPGFEVACDLALDASSEETLFRFPALLLPSDAPAQEYPVEFKVDARQEEALREKFYSGVWMRFRLEVYDRGMQDGQPLALTRCYLDGQLLSSSLIRGKLNRISVCCMRRCRLLVDNFTVRKMTRKALED